MIIYKITNMVNGKIYIGKTTVDLNKRFEKHLKNALLFRRNSRLYSAIRKYGSNNFKIESIYSLLPKERMQSNLNKYEIYYISYFKSQNPDIGYNMTVGGDGGRNEKSMIASSRKRKNKTFEEIYGKEKALQARQAISNSLKQFYTNNKMVLSQATKNKISNSHKKKNNIDKQYHNRLLSHIRKIREYRINFSHSEETKDKLSKFRKGKKYQDIMDKETSMRLRELHRKQFENNNPRRILIDVAKQIDLVKSILGSKHTVEYIANQNSISSYLIRKIFRKYGVSNIQKTRLLPEQEIKSIMEIILQKIVDIGNPL